MAMPSKLISWTSLKHIKTHDSIAAASRSLDLASDDGGICAHLNQQMGMSMASRYMWRRVE
jgi:hypothetical protein